MLDKLLGRFRRKANGYRPQHAAVSPAPPIPPPPPAATPTAATPAPPPPPPGYVAPGSARGPRVRMMFDDGSVATSLDDPEQEAQLGYILKNLLPPA